MARSLALLLGKEPTKPDPARITKKATAFHADMSRKRDKEAMKKFMVLRHEVAAGPKKWRRVRWSVLILVNVLFILSYRVDLQLMEGALTGSRFAGFHLADLNAALQVMLAYKQV
ncbi:ferredoxin, partial [bacterium DOLZORAL124_64_63]